ncbi:hypothetical protein VTJ49DRAFT_5472 [Mycothermus thermophilus]|uniref:Uncharacterized protein n=1 Tax=Humicola insolens TaxID=85995 RepID=A0ABR3V331_HUMIN
MELQRNPSTRSHAPTTPTIVQSRIDFLASQSSNEHPYPRPDLNNLNTYLNNASSTRPGSTGLGHQFGWLKAVDNKYDPSPELYRRHLDFALQNRDYYTSPSLPSASARVFQLTISTICTRDIDALRCEPEDLANSRHSETKAMAEDFKNLGSHTKVADSVLPLSYGSFLDRDLARRDAVYALSELFRFAASAELQFLNLLHHCIEHELSFVGLHPDTAGNPQGDEGRDTVILLNLKYIKTQLAAHARSLAETINILRNRASLDWPRADDEDDPAGLAEKTATLLLADYEYLLQRAETLTRDCEHGMDTLANSSMVQEARRSAHLATTVQRLTIINTIFIPLSFVCSVCGMNFQGLDKQSLWLWPVTTVPIAVIIYILYEWQ